MHDAPTRAVVLYHNRGRSLGVLYLVLLLMGGMLAVVHFCNISVLFAIIPMAMVENSCGRTTVHNSKNQESEACTKSIPEYFSRVSSPHLYSCKPFSRHHH